MVEPASLIEVPPDEDRAWSEEALAKLLATRGLAPFVAAPLILPTRDFFPDAWTPDAEGAARMAQRLLGYAGLNQLRVDLTVRPASEMEDADSGSERHTAAWFAGIEGERCRFGVRDDVLLDPPQLVGALAHEVAHAYRRKHGLAVADTEVEELLTDLTTVFLGFGVLTVNASYHVRGRTYVSYSVTSWQKLGYLPPQALSYLLALQLHLRDDDELSRRVKRELPDVQKRFVEKSLELLDGDDAPVAQRLGVPPRSTWPSSSGPEGQPLAPLTARTEAVQDRRAGRVVFRWKRHRRPRFLSALVLLVPALLQVDHVFLPGGGHGLALFEVVLAMAVALLVAEARTARDACSEPDCHAPLPLAALRCPGCGGVISGRIQHLDERIIRRWEMEERASPEDRPD